MVFATLSQKTLPKSKNEEHWKTKTPTHREPPKNKGHTLRGGKRTCYLVLLLLHINGLSLNLGVLAPPRHRPLGKKGLGLGKEVRLQPVAIACRV